LTLPQPAAPDRRRTLVASATGGVGLTAGVDRIVFHQLMGWHHLYDGSTGRVGVLTDGLVNHKVLGLHQVRYGVEDLLVT
jgi:uncharacterized membrane protein